MKKPVRYPFLDFRSLAARRDDCAAELRLNRRLAPDVYLGLVPLTVDRQGRLALGDGGDVVDWLVEMRRLPGERLLDHMIAEGTVQADHVEDLARRLADFYGSAEPADVFPTSYVEGFRSEQARTADVLRDGGLGLERELADAALGEVDRGLTAGRDLLEGRVEAGRIVDGHGDLRPEHVCLTRPPRIIDCLEFSRALRLVDPFDELIFLSLECHALGAGWIGSMLLERCAALLGDAPPAPVLSFYWIYRACLRARLSLIHLREPEHRERKDWVAEARDHLRLGLSGPTAPLPAASR